ncbi:ATP phosphoribosyltransferase [Nanoarchaeota archaeon]
MIKLAVPNKGRLSDKTVAILNRAGFKFNNVTRRLSSRVKNYDMEIIFARARDIPEFLSKGTVDMGITGLDVVFEKKSDARKLLDLDYGGCELVLAAPKTKKIKTIAELKKIKNSRIATSFPNITKTFLDLNKVKAEIIEMSGAVELAPKLGIADAIVDLSSSGETLKINDLAPVQTIMESTACLFANKDSMKKKKDDVNRVKTALDSVLFADEKKYLMANIPKKSMGKVKTIIPGLSSPTIMPLMGTDDLFAVQAVVDEKDTANIVEKLKKLGATGILILNIEQLTP